MKEAQPKAIALADYRPPAFLIEHTELFFDLHEDYAEVSSTLRCYRNPAPDAPRSADLVLQGEGLELQSLSIDGRALTADDYALAPGELRVRQVPESFTLACVTRCRPRENKSLEGLYNSRTMFCTQCEAEGFRKITYYLDRPDVLSRFRTTIEADAARYPVLLSNGNPVGREALANGRHRACWDDPFNKPCYLFALVAGDLRYVQGAFTTMSGREVDLRIYVEEKDLDKCEHAMQSLQRAMRWDEDVYGREYDLDIYMIVAVDDFNMGAMENKGLNIFNTSCVLANTAITTDAGFARIEAIIAHEYFHNWSGNRVTCRDWFQLSLKEGFTVFRDASFSADLNSATVKRVEDVKLLRTQQFAEDAGPTAHPIRPDSYIEIANFYTLTIYEKGAEVVRMLHHLLGAEAFRAGSDLYFERHDGRAATCDDFIDAMAEASGRDLNQFRRWYSQVGTPRLDASDDYDADAGTYTLTLEQHRGDGGEALLIPVSMGLVGRAGPLPLHLEGAAVAQEMVLELSARRQSFVFRNVAERPVPSLLRDFSAPVKLHYPYTPEQLLFLMSRDSDGFNRWDACQTLATGMLQRMIDDYRAARPLAPDDGLIGALRQLLEDDSLDPAMVALMLQLPSEAWLSEQAEIIHAAAIHRAREAARQGIGRALQDTLLAAYDALHSTAAYRPDSEQAGRRSLRNQCLGYLSATGSAQAIDWCEAHYRAADNMTDVLAALQCLTAIDHDSAVERSAWALDDFYRRWQHEPLAVNQWFQVQAVAPLPGALGRVRELLRHPAYDRYNPNKVRALVAAFCAGNPLHFHAEDGSGYRFLAEQVDELDGSNPQLAARLLTPLTRWRKYPAPNAEAMHAALQGLAERPALSRDVYEIVSKSLG